MNARLFMLFLLGGSVFSSSLVNYVDTRIGSGSSGSPGNTYPATGTPWANTFMSPQTQPNETKCIPPYYSWDTTMSGFRASHFVSGSCMQDYGSMTVMPLFTLPTNGSTFESSYAMTFDKTSEVSLPHYYSVDLIDRGRKIHVNMSSTDHCGIVEFVFPTTLNQDVYILMKPNSDHGEGTVTASLSTQQISITNPAHRIYAEQGQSAGFQGNYDVVVMGDTQAKSCGIIDGNLVRSDVCSIQGTGGQRVGSYFVFPPNTQRVTVSMCHSFTTVQNAVNNRIVELGIPNPSNTNMTVSSVASNAQQLWNQQLSAVQIYNVTDEVLTIFYTAMYHALLHPRNFGDAVTNAHVPFDNGYLNTHNTFIPSPSTYFDDYSMWDTFRVVQPWISLVAPNMLTAMARSLILKYRQGGGWMPIFPVWNSETNEMIGDHATVVLCDAIAKGLFPETDGFTVSEVMEAGWKNADKVPNATEALDGKGRRSIDAYKAHNFVPIDVPTGKNQQVSITLEYAYDDFVLGSLMKSRGDKRGTSLLSRSDTAWRAVIDPVVGYARGKFKNQSWVSPFNPFKGVSYITEATPFEYTWFVPHAVPSLVTYLGGATAVAQKLDLFFNGGHYDPTNEPDIQVPYYYNYVGQPWKTQYWIRNLTLSQYSTTPQGIPGNDDAGAMSSWYLFSMLGFYPVCHGGGSSQKPKYLIGAPQVPAYQLGNLFVEAQGLSSKNMYIQSVTWNGVSYENTWIFHSDLVKGGKVVFVMGSSPSMWGTQVTVPSC